MTIRISLTAVISALVFAAIGAGGAVGVILWEPWDGDGEGGRTVVEPSPIADTPSLQPTDVFDLFIAACLGESAVEIVFEEMPRGGRNNRLWGDWLKSSFEYEANGWWRVRPSVGIFWRIHEFTADVQPDC